MKEENIQMDHHATCPSCGKLFFCNAGDIKQCGCTQISLSPVQQTELKTSFSTCLCNACLALFKEGKIHSINEKISLNVSAKINTLFVLFFFSLASVLHSQTYAPPAEQVGSSAMHKDSSSFVSWVKACQVTRGFQDISNKALGYASVGDESMVIGKALSNGVLSLGDGGSVICEFDHPIMNGEGFDFAVFENSIDDTFLELAFVEVSSDGINFYRFKSHSLTDTLVQTGSFGSTDAVKINNLAGKYRAGFGTPFDLDELDNITGLNINAITHIRIVDVIGTMNNAYAQRDGNGNKINDPWPTPFPSGGFDLDAIGVIHENRIVSLKEVKLQNPATVFPNPAQKGERVYVKQINGIKYCEILSLAGELLVHSKLPEISTQTLNEGVYLLKIVSQGDTQFVKLIVH